MWRNNFPFDFRHTTHIGHIAYQAIMPSGFQIVQSILLKIYGFKLNIDRVESLNKIWNIFFINLKKNFNGYFKMRSILAFSKIK